jgi:hypothetical protein
VRREKPKHREPGKDDDDGRLMERTKRVELLCRREKVQ